MFSISVSDLHWMEGLEESKDLCLHGNVIAKIGDETFEYDATVSSTALYLLKSLRKDHIIYESNHMLPCCGYFMIPNADLSEVEICGCAEGIDWSVYHEGDNVILITESKKVTKIPYNDYKNTVFVFADKIEDFYNKSKPKTVPKDEKGYIAFWNEWKSIRY